MARALADTADVSLPLRDMLARLGERLHLYSGHGSAANSTREAFFRPALAGDILGWVSLIPGLAARLQAEASIAEYRCHEGEVCVLLAQAFENARVFGFDSDGAALVRARQAADESGTHRVEFASAAGFGVRSYDLIILRDCLSTPVILAQARAALSSMGVVLLIESDSKLAEQGLRRADFTGIHILCKSESHSILQAQ